MILKNKVFCDFCGKEIVQVKPLTEYIKDNDNGYITCSDICLAELQQKED